MTRTKRPYRPITDDDKRRVRDLAADNYRDCEIAFLLGVDETRVRRIRQAAKIPPGVEGGRPPADAAATVVGRLITAADREAVRRHVIALVDTGEPYTPAGGLRVIVNDHAPQEQAA